MPFSLPKNFFLSFLCDKIACFVNQVCYCTVRKFALYLQISSCLLQVLNKLLEISPLGEVKFYMMALLLILFKKVLNIFCFTRILNFEHLEKPCFKISWIFFDVLLRISRQFPQSFLMMGWVHMAMISIFIFALFSADFTKMF